MKLQLTFILILLLQFVTAQNYILKFETSSNYTDGIPLFQKEKTILSEEYKIDISFFKKHFGEFHTIPKTLSKEHLKNQEIREWGFQNRTKEWNTNWVVSYKYDSDGKLIEYKYSGCKGCSQMPWGYKLIYDSKNRIIEQQSYGIKLNFNLKKDSIPDKFELNNILNNRIILKYDSENNITRFERYSTKGIEYLIELSN
tara:strand:+ start:164 stop:760 length:597 start_codon:yes stop_codon:yes gene_type:complete